MAFTQTTLAQKEEQERDKTMTVSLKQRTYRTKDGNAVGEGDTKAAFLVGAEGAKITDETAVSLGLIDGHLRDSEAVTKERRDAYDKEKNKGEDKSGRRKAATGRPVNSPKPKEERLAGAIRKMVEEVKADATKKEELFNLEGIPDSQVLSTRLESKISKSERDVAWSKFLQEQESSKDKEPKTDADKAPPKKEGEGKTENEKEKAKGKTK